MKEGIPTQVTTSQSSVRVNQRTLAGYGERSTDGPDAGGDADAGRGTGPERTALMIDDDVMLIDQLVMKPINMKA